jgi:hypothetical protein
MIMKKDTITLTKEDFSFVCPLKTEDMKSVDGGYFCQKCEKKVHDVTHMSQEDFQTLKQKSENICVTFHKVAAVSLVLGLSACTSKPLTGKIAPTSSCDSNITKNSANNRLAPFRVVDKNQTIIIDHVEEPQIAGGITVPENMPQPIEEPTPKEKK